jgi:hypothetical protein
MKYILLLLIFFALLPVGLHSQDTIVKKNGVLIPCKIYKEDSIKVNYGVMRNGNEILTFLSKDSIQSTRYALINEKTEAIIIDKASFGFGYGQDFGGLGANVIIYPQKNIGLFLGGGYAFAGFGYNAGIKVRLTNNSSSKVNPFAIGMYGYNAAISVTNAEQFNKLFYGSTIGIGVDFLSRPGIPGYLSIALLIPFRNSEVNDYINDLKTNHGVEFKSELLPVTFSFGYRFIIN